MARTYVAARNADEELAVNSDMPIWGVWDREAESWAEVNCGRWYWDAQLSANRRQYQKDNESLPLDEDDRWEAVAAWLNTYYHNPPGLMTCIRSQEDWKYVDIHAERFAGAQFEPGPQAMREGIDFAISALVECHDGPHDEACPYYRA